MDYALAKQLKDAGFPQFHFHPYDTYYTRSGDLLLTSDQIGPLRTSNGMMVPHQEFVKAPFLAELIAVCADKTFWLDAQADSSWQAGITQDDGASRYEEGANPTEAVARLWLALNRAVEK